MSAISVVVPVYNGARTVQDLVSETNLVLTRLGTKFEVILVDDGSKDASWARIVDLATSNPGVVGMRLSRNFGQHNALLAGIRRARYPVIVTMDDDLQHPPSEIPRLLEELGKGFDVVYGVPSESVHRRWRALASLATKWVLRRFMGAVSAESVSAFRAFRADLRNAFETYRGPLVSIDVLLTWGGQRFAAVTVSHRERMVGRSNYTVWKLIAHAWNMLTGFGALPLQVASYLGFVLTIFGVCVLVFVFARVALEGRAVPGFAFLAAIIAIFSGAQLFALGVIGEYLARIHFRVLDQPSYVLRESVGARAGEAGDR